MATRQWPGFCSIESEITRDPAIDFANLSRLTPAPCCGRRRGSASAKAAAPTPMRISAGPHHVSPWVQTFQIELSPRIFVRSFFCRYKRNLNRADYRGDVSFAKSEKERKRRTIGISFNFAYETRSRRAASASLVLVRLFAIRSMRSMAIQHPDDSQEVDFRRDP